MTAQETKQEIQVIDSWCPVGTATHMIVFVPTGVNFDPDQFGLDRGYFGASIYGEQTEPNGKRVWVKCWRD